MATFLDAFPKVRYDVRRQLYSNYETVPNITFRIAFVKEILENTASYYKYSIVDGDTPEGLANKVYGDPEAHWMILYANNIYDPHYDWPLNETSFIEYIISKYGSVSWAQTNTRHYEKVITREVRDTVTINRFQITQDQLTNNDTRPDLPLIHDYYYDDIADEQSFTAYNVNGTTVKETIARDSISYYDHEFNLNEQKREIKIIKTIYYPQIKKEFEEMMGIRPALLRGLF